MRRKRAAGRPRRRLEFKHGLDTEGWSALPSPTSFLGAFWGTLSVPSSAEPSAIKPRSVERGNNGYSSTIHLHEARFNGAMLTRRERSV
jgi:hypothetical protein